MADQTRIYDIALSFAGEDRKYVSQVASLLKERNVKVFFDEYEQVSLWGKDLYQHLSDVYKNKADYTVIFISKHYAEKLWTKHELKSAQERAFTESKEYILPARFDETEIPGILLTTRYVDISNISPTELADLIIQKLGRSFISYSAIDSVSFNRIKSEKLALTRNFFLPRIGINLYYSKDKVDLNSLKKSFEKVHNYLDIQYIHFGESSFENEWIVEILYRNAFDSGELERRYTAILRVEGVKSPKRWQPLVS